MSKNIFYVIPNGGQWDVNQPFEPGTVTFATEKAAHDYARKAARAHPPSALVVGAQGGEELYRELFFI
jgi:hypothetical protein